VPEIKKITGMKLKNLFGLLLIWAVVFLRAVPGEAQEWSMKGI